ncbi:MAG: efflux RND transporter periplasmic adaptor subunit [Polyangiaceae bacterium]|nr:efflux RND transporter periplasmic adaptor subunit [Polyangiaceae bacterium]
MTEANPVHAHELAPRRASLATALGVGLALGVAATLAVVGVVTPRLSSRATAPRPAFSVDRDGVTLAGQGAPLSFDTRRVELGPPLPRQPVTARVATIDARTGPSFAPLDGRVTRVAVRLGDRVKEGDKLVLVQSGDLATLHRELRAAQLSIRTKRAFADRLRLLVDARVASTNDLMVAESELGEATLAATAASSRMRSLGVKPDGDTGYWILAARAGIVVQLDATLGKQVGPDRDRPVATVADLDEVLVVGDVSKRDAATLSAGMDAVITEPGAADQAPLAGKVDVVSDVVDPERQTVPIRIRVKNDKLELRPNEFVEAVFAPRASDEVVTVPTEAVVSDGATSVVFVEQAPGVLRRRAVRLGRQTRERTEIVSGLTEGERVVVRGALLLLNAIDVRG